MTQLNHFSRLLVFGFVLVVAAGCNDFEAYNPPPPPCDLPQACLQTSLITDLSCIRTNKRYTFRNAHPSRALFMTYKTTTIYHDGSSAPTDKYTPRAINARDREIADCEFSPSSINKDYLRENIVSVTAVCWADDCQLPNPKPTPKPDEPQLSCIEKCNTPGDVRCLRLAATTPAEQLFFNDWGGMANTIVTTNLPSTINTNQFETALSCSRQDLSLGLSYASWFGNPCGFKIKRVRNFLLNGRPVASLVVHFGPNIQGGFSRKLLVREATWEFAQDLLAPEIEFQMQNPVPENLFDSVTRIDFRPSWTVITGKTGYCVRFAHPMDAPSGSR